MAARVLNPDFRRTRCTWSFTVATVITSSAAISLLLRPPAISEATSRSRGPDLTITVDRIDIVGEVVEATWVCESPIFVRPTRGLDRFTIRRGKIVRLESTMTEAPELAH
jgi:hypothetical protein